MFSSLERSRVDLFVVYHTIHRMPRGKSHRLPSLHSLDLLSLHLGGILPPEKPIRFSRLRLRLKTSRRKETRGKEKGKKTSPQRRPLHNQKRDHPWVSATLDFSITPTGTDLSPVKAREGHKMWVPGSGGASGGSSGGFHHYEFMENKDGSLQKSEWIS